MTNAGLIYSKLPVWAQNWACSYYGRREARIRYSPAFHEKLQWLQDTEFWPTDRIAAYKDERVRALAEHAYRTVPYYRRVFDEYNLKPDDIQGADDLPKLPILTKEDVRANLPDLISRDYRQKNLVEVHTSGTTATRLVFFKHPDAIAFQWAVWWRHRIRFGCRLGDPHVNFTGKPVVPAGQARPPYWRYNSHLSQHLINMHHVTPDKIGDIVGFLNALRPKFYSGYPSIISEVARLAMENSLELQPEARPGLIFAGAENVLDFQRGAIEAWTRGRVTDQYGASEGCGNASLCKHDVYHEDFEFAHLECDQPGALDDGSTRSRVLCTGFANPAMPLIRYDIGDVAVWEPADYQCKCGRKSMAICSIDGRIDDYVLTPEGRRIMRFDYLFKDTPAISEAQVCQFREGEITVRVVRRPGYGAEDDEQLRKLLAQWISPLLEVNIEHVATLEREPNGKLRAVKSYLKQ